MSQSRVLLTGATGFIGRHVAVDLMRRGLIVRAAVRDSQSARLLPTMEIAETGDLDPAFDWRKALVGVDHVVHAAGLAHADGPIAASRYDLVNTQGTLGLARAAQEAGIQRFVFLSSIRAQAGFAAAHPLTETDAPCPTDAYGRSKLAAEQGLAALDMDWITLRPVLVYGPQVKANMATLLRLARLPLPLPLAGFRQERSILALENLAGAIAFALSGDCPARRAYIVSDPAPISVAEMIGAMRAGLGRAPGLFSVPLPVLKGAAALLGQTDRFHKLSAGLVALPTALLAAGWRPALTTRAALQALPMRYCAA